MRQCRGCERKQHRVSELTYRVLCTERLPRSKAFKSGASSQWPKALGLLRRQLEDRWAWGSWGRSCYLLVQKSGFLESLQ